jgi:hypothetical protein
MRRTGLLGALVLLAVPLSAARARADGGTLRLSQQAGPYRVAVFTAPAPLRAGPVDVSVFVQDAATGAPLTDVAVGVTLTPAGEDSPLSARASRRAATNKLFQAAEFDLPAAGAWRLEVEVEGSRGTARVACDVEAAGPLPRWRELWPWIAWPVVPVVLFAVREVLAWKARRRAGVLPEGRKADG